MGCDIHLVVEFGENRFNEEAIKIRLDRCYLMFGLMAGVRGRDVLFERKGLPENLSYTTKHEYKDWKEDAHNCSWLSYEEYKKCVDKYCVILKETYKEEENYNIETRPNIYFVLLSLLENLQKRYKYVRIVFWFDN
mgnify:CR=1 FL=1